MKRTARALAVAAVLVSLAGNLGAQDFRATIVGQVTDESKGAIPGATVKAIRVETNEVFETVTSDDGYYTIPYLIPGKYTVEASMPSFTTLKREGIILLVADRLNLPLTLLVGQVAESITVVGEQALIQTETASRGLNFDPIKTQEYPLNGRQVYMLMALTPGVLFTQEQFGATGFSGTRGWDVNGSYIINGGRSGTNQFLLNGAPISLTGSWQLSPNVEAIQEFKVMTNTYDSQYGRTGGGTVNTTLKSGTNEWHGSVFDFWRNSILDANSYQGNLRKHDPSVDPRIREQNGRGRRNMHQFGGVVGGPVRKDKDFILFSFEGWREIVPFPIVTNTPRVDLRDGKNFSKYGIKVYDPRTNRLCKSGVDTPKGTNCFSTYIRTQFETNIIPDNRISPIGKAILALYPAPNGPGLTQNFFASGNQGRYRYDQPMVRWDHVFSERDRLNVIFTFQDGWEFRSNNGFPPPAEVGQIRSERRDQNYIIDWTHVVSPTTVFNARTSYGRFRSMFPDGQNSFGFTFDKLGIKRLPNAPTVDRKTAPRINLDQANAIIGNSFSRNIDGQYNLASGLTQTRGRHTLHYGFEFVHAVRVGFGLGRANGEFSFDRFWTQQYSTRGQGTSDGSGVASLLLGLPSGGFIDWNQDFYRSWQYYAFYVQDDWKVGRSLTLNLGLRWDVQVPFRERFDRVNSGFDFNTKNPLSDQVIANWTKLKAEFDKTNPKYPYPDPPKMILGGKTFAGKDRRRPYDTDWTNIQPRLGLAWAFLPKTVLRTGFGIYHRTATQQNLTDGFNQRTNYIRSLDGDILPAGGLTGPRSLEDPFPDGIIAPSGNSLGLLTNIGRGVSFDGRQLIIPRTFQYSLGIERELPWDMVLEVAYAGSQTVKDTHGYQRNAVSFENRQKGIADPIYLNGRVPNPYFGILPATSDLGGGSQTTYENLRRPYPQFTGVFQNTNPWARYRYDALQVRGEKRAFGNRSAGILTFVVSYSFTKSFEANHRLNDWNLREPSVHEVSNQDKPHNFAFSGVWDLPIGINRRWFSNRPALVGAFSDGWTFDWILTYYSGYPVGRPNATFLCKSNKVDRPTELRWFNNDRSCYQARPPFALRIEDDRFSNIRNPAKPQLNVAMAKNVRIGERYTLHLRGEAFNATNTPIRPGPDTGFQNPRFGRLGLTQQNFPRNVQIAAKVIF